MAHILQKPILFLSIIALALGGPRAAANPVGDFFKKVGHSISKLKRSSPPKTARKTSRDDQKNEEPASKEEVKSASPATTPTPAMLETRPATTAPASRERPRDLPYGVAVSNRPGLVTSPYAPNEGFVDVRAFPSSTEVMDPFTGKIFLTP